MEHETYPQIANVSLRVNILTGGDTPHKGRENLTHLQGGERPAHHGWRLSLTKKIISIKAMADRKAMIAIIYDDAIAWDRLFSYLSHTNQTILSVGGWGLSHYVAALGGLSWALSLNRIPEGTRRLEKVKSHNRVLVWTAREWMGPLIYTEIIPPKCHLRVREMYMCIYMYMCVAGVVTGRVTSYTNTSLPSPSRFMRGKMM